MLCNLIIVLDEHAPYTSHVISNGSSALSRTIHLAYNVDITFNNKIILRINTDESSMPLHLREEFTVVDLENSTSAFIEYLFSQMSDETDSSEHICITWADNLLQYAPLYKKIWDMHITYHAHYTYAEGYPRGVSPFFVSRKCVQLMRGIIHNTEDRSTQQYIHTLSRESLFSVMEMNINEFDIEMCLAKQDMRDLRMSLTGDTRRNFVIGKQLLENKLENPDEIYEMYYTSPQLFRGPPCYVYFQITNTIVPRSYVPLQINEGLEIASEEACISVDTFKVYVQKIVDFTPETTLCLGYNGEVLSHPHFCDILEIACKTCKEVYIETTGRGWRAHAEHSAWTQPWATHVTWIVSMDSNNPHTYQLIHNTDMDEVSSFIDFLISKVDSEKIFVEAVRMPENEDDLESFMTYWTDKGVHPIIKKYNDYCTSLPDKKVVDMSPIKRFACHHLARDLTVLLNGKITMCAQAMRPSHIVADLETQSMEEIWQANDVRFVDHVNNKFEDICGTCDEYYTVNT